MHRLDRAPILVHVPSAVPEVVAVRAALAPGPASRARAPLRSVSVPDGDIAGGKSRSVGHCLSPVRSPGGLQARPTMPGATRAAQLRRRFIKNLRPTLDARWVDICQLTPHH